MRTIMTIALAAVLSQNTGDRPDAHVARARIAAGDSYQNLFNFLCTVPTPRGGGSASAKATADRPTWYAEPVKVFDNDDVVRQAGADIILSNHTDWDGSKVNLPRLATRAPGSPNPYVVGNAAARRYLKVAEECATARLLRLN